MPEERFRLPESSYDELAKIIKAYGTLSAEAAPPEVSKIATMHHTMVSRNNAFLVAIGVLEGGKKKIITDRGRKLALALEHGMADEVTAGWRDIVLANEFLQRLLTAVRIRKGMDASTLKAHVAYSAGQPKKPGTMTGAGAVVDILKAAGLLKEEEGKLIAVFQEPLERKGDAIPPRQEGREQVISFFGHPATTRGGSTPVAREGLAVSIQIQIQCSASEVEGLVPKLRALLNEISRPVAPDEPQTGE